MTKTVEVLDALMGSGKTSVVPTHEVYVAKAGEYVLYVGKGKIGRHKHCKGGVSHVYGLNLCHFTNTEITVEVVHLSDSKVDCEKMELELISSLKPALNKAVNNVHTALLVKQFLRTKARFVRKSTYIASFLKSILDNNEVDRMIGGFVLDSFVKDVSPTTLVRSKDFKEMFEEVPYITTTRCYRIRQSLLNWK